jgi:hypothetical protein
MKEMASDARLWEWGVSGFEELFEYKDESAEISEAENSEETSNDGSEIVSGTEGGEMDVDED